MVGIKQGLLKMIPLIIACRGPIKNIFLWNVRSKRQKVTMITAVIGILAGLSLQRQLKELNEDQTFDFYET